jgi:hypothetical protein
MYSGNWGPGTLVVSRLYIRVEKCSREAWAKIVGGAKSSTLAITSAPMACLDSFRSAIEATTSRWRSTESST